MLRHLRITNFALLDDVEVELGSGFNVLTGETGAGKSLLVDAVALLRGGRASADVVRTGAEEARVEAVFEPPHGPAADALAERLMRAGIDAVEEGLIVRRVIGRTGRGRVYINNSLSTAGALGDVAGVLIELAGQHEHQTLGDSAHHLAILDAFGEHGALVGQMADAHGRVAASAAALAGATLDERTRSEREDFLRFCLNELDGAHLEPGEDERLTVELKRLRSSEKLHSGVRRAEDALYAREASVVEEVSTLGRELGDLAKLDPELAPLAKQIEEAAVSLEDAAQGLRRYAEGIDGDPERLGQVEERLDLLRRICRKHGGDLTEVLRRRDQMAEELAGLQGHEARRAGLGAALEEARADAAQVAEQLSEARRKTARTLSQRVGRALAELAMEGARLSPLVESRPGQKGDDAALLFADGTRRLGPTGWDHVEFLLSANRGEEPRPLQRIASGGELSRIMLALKRVLSRADKVATYVFDEVDAGIGGAVADVVGKQIRGIADDKQVVCITHLAQIAAYADAHFRVEKEEQKGRVRTLVRRLDGTERKEEVARMLGGAKITPRARAHAEEMLRSART